MDLALNNLQWLMCHKTKPILTINKMNNKVQILVIKIYMTFAEMT